jgi:hypothetical protein
MDVEDKVEATLAEDAALAAAAVEDDDAVDDAVAVVAAGAAAVATVDAAKGNQHPVCKPAVVPGTCTCTRAHPVACGRCPFHVCLFVADGAPLCCPPPPAPAAKPAAKLTAGAEPVAAELAADKLEKNHMAAPVAPAPAAKPAVQRREPRAAKRVAAELTAVELAAAKLVELADPAELAAKRAVATKPTKPGVARSARVPRRAPIAAAPIAQQLNFLTCPSMDLLSDTCASADAVITDPDKVPKPNEEASAEAEETAEDALVVEAEENVAPPVAQHAQPAKRRPPKNSMTHTTFLQIHTHKSLENSISSPPFPSGGGRGRLPIRGRSRRGPPRHRRPTQQEFYPGNYLGNYGLR